jgi:hypothetical protein
MSIVYVWEVTLLFLVCTCIRDHLSFLFGSCEIRGRSQSFYCCFEHRAILQHRNFPEARVQQPHADQWRFPPLVPQNSSIVTLSSEAPESDSASRYFPVPCSLAHRGEHHVKVALCFTIYNLRAIPSVKSIISVFSFSHNNHSLLSFHSLQSYQRPSF